MNRLIAAMSALGVLLLAPLLALGQPLVDRIPKDALIYVGWKGSDALGPAYDASHLKAMLDGSNLPEFFSDVIPKIVQRVGQENPEAGGALQMALGVLTPMWKHPSALYVGPVEFANPPMPHVALLCDAGADAPALLAQLKQDVALIPPGPFPVDVKEYKGLVALLIGTPDPAFEALLQGGAAQDHNARTLQNSFAFQEAIKQVGTDPVVTVYIDTEAILRLVDAVVNLQDELQPKTQWPKLRDALGLSGLKRIVVTSGFDGKNWSDQCFVSAPEPRTGLLAGMAGSPISDETLKLIPKGAVIATVGKFNVAGFYGALHDAVKQVDADAGAQVDAVLEQVNQMLGLDLQKDVLGSLGDEWAVYSDPSLGGEGLLGYVLVNRMADAAKAEKSFTALEGIINSLARENMPDKRINVSIQQKQVNGLTIHYLDIPLITPSWAIKDGALYVALYPQMVVAAAEYNGGHGPSLLENEAYQSVRKAIGGGPAQSIQFMDLPRTAPESYGELVALSRLLAVADIFGVQTPALLLPTLPKVMEQLEPAGGISWVDAAGWHMRGIAPFPGCEVFAGGSGSSMSVGTMAMMTSILLPSLNRARETANRVKSASNLRQIGQGCMLYSNEHNGAFPPDLGTLLMTEDLTLDAFLPPETSDRLPASVRADKKEQQAAWINDNCDYVYLGAGKNNTAPADVIIAYEKPHVHGNQGANVLYADGHVDFMSVATVNDLLTRQGVQIKQ